MKTNEDIIQTIWENNGDKEITKKALALKDKEVENLINEVLLERRKQINIAFEGKDERMMAHLHTFVNKFEEELKQRLGLGKKQADFNGNGGFLG